MKQTKTRLFSMFAFAFAAASGSMALGPAGASAACAAVAGTMSLRDLDFADVCAFVPAGQDDPDYTLSGANDRFDEFGNSDDTFGRSLCLYNDVNFGAFVLELRPGEGALIRNTVSSHRWASPGGC
jgi:hypothetical protein